MRVNRATTDSGSYAENAAHWGILSPVRFSRLECVLDAGHDALNQAGGVVIQIRSSGFRRN